MKASVPHLPIRTAVLAAASVVVASGCSFMAYDLPAEPGEYTYTIDQEDDYTKTKTAWTFVTSEVTENDQDPHFPCLTSAFPLGELPCRAEPLIFLRYDLGQSLDNTVRAGRDHRITVTGFHQDRTSPPEVTDLDLWASFDDGSTWQPVPTRRTVENTFSATIAHPRLADTTGSVGLRVKASDAAGNRVEQTIETAYRLR